MPPRYLEKVESVDASLSYTFPTLAYEMSESTPTRVPIATVVGADFGYDLLGTGRTLRDAGRMRVRFVVDATTPTLLDTGIDTLKAIAARVGLCKVFTLGADGTRRWCFARVTDLPEITLGQPNELFLPTAVGFRRQSDWFGSALVAGGGPFVITAIDQVIVVNNPGNLPVRAMTIRIRANTTTGINWPGMTISGGVNTPWFYVSRVGSTVNDEVKIDTGAPSAMWSTNDGGSYVDDYANFFHGYASWFTLDPGNNSIVVGAAPASTPRVNIEFSFYPAWA